MCTQSENCVRLIRNIFPQIVSDLRVCCRGDFFLGNVQNFDSARPMGRLGQGVY
ncbi:hypothetical protein HMPREF1980_02105 [Actinomyces sp. oral taxon 172 str. F0311]|nr:hypothetical protein HMPREF1980_02105 [Actinomyces sp. oral taxon 172 str. F0311]